MWSRSFFSAAVAVALACGSAAAATFSVDPISIPIARSNTSASVAVVNQSTSPLRIQVTGFAWQQSAQGKMLLTPTDDLIFFPQLLTLAPGETKRIRVGVTAPQGALEKTYRLFIEELPSLQSVVAPAKGASLTIRLKVGVPIFLAPAGQPKASGEVRNARISDQHVEFDVANTGTIRYSISTVGIAGKDASGARIFSAEEAGWYVLAGQVRHYSIPLKQACGSIAAVSIDVKTNAGSFNGAFPVLSKDCAVAPIR